MSEADPVVSPDRRYALWFGALLLDAGRVIELPNGRPELHIRTGNGTKKVLLSIRDKPIDPTARRAIVGRIDDLDARELPHVIVILGADAHDTESLAFLPVARTRASWVNDGREYTVAADKLVDFDRLNEWLDQLGPCS